MKKFLMALVVVATVSMLAGCDFAKTYFYEASMGSIGTCGEIVTADKDIQNDAIKNGYKEGTCPSEYTGTTCVYTYKSGDSTATATIYFKGFSEDLIKSTCTTMGGTIK